MSDDLNNETGKLFAKMMSEHIELAFINHTANTQPSQPLTLEAVKKAIAALALSTEKRYAIHMDDALMILREARKAGFKIKRELSLGGKKSFLFTATANTVTLFFYVDPFRTGTRGRIIEIKPLKWELPRIEFQRPEIDWSAWYSWRNRWW